MKIETKYNIGDIVYGIAYDGTTSHGSISYFLTGPKGTEAILHEGGKSCYIDSLGDTESEAFKHYCIRRYSELTSEMTELKSLAALHGIELK